MSCLIIKNDGIGDLILASGLISAVGEIFSGNLDLLTCSDNQEIAEGIESVRERFYVSRDGLRFSSTAEKFGLLIPRAHQEDQLVLRALATRRYDTVICLRRFIRQSTLVIMSNVRAKQKFCAWEFPTNASVRMAERTSKHWKHYSSSVGELSELSYNKSFLVHALGTTIASQPHLSYCKRQISKPTTRRIALGLGGVSANWPYEYWIELAVHLATEGWRLVLLGGDNVSDLAIQIMMKLPATDNLVGQLAWHNMAELLLDCEGYIGNDTGLSHFASLIVQKTVVILGGGTFRRFFPWPDAENQHVIYYGLDCFDCDWNCKYQERLCLSLVRPCNVVDCFHEVMEGKAKPEYDLNPENPEYQVSWRRKPGSSKSFTRG